MIIERLKGLETPRKYQPWLRVYRIGNKVYDVANVLHPAFWRHLRVDWGGDLGVKFRAFRFWLLHPVNFKGTLDDWGLT